MTEDLLDKANEDLAAAAARGDLAQVKSLLHLMADPKHDHSKALRRAAAGGHDAIAELLVQKGADINAMQGEALRNAVTGNHESAVELLLKLGADPDAMEGEPLIKAAATGKERIVRALITHRADVHFSDDQALRKASFNGHAGIVRALLNAGADPFAMRGTALALANPEKHGAVVEILSERMNEMREAFLFELASQDATRGFLRLPYQATGESAFIRAVKMNCLDAAVSKMKQSDGSLSFADLHGLTDREGQSLAALASERGQLRKLFDGDLWRGNLDELQKAWENIPNTLRAQSGVTADDFQSIVAQHRHGILRQNAQKFRLKPPGL